MARAVAQDLPEEDQELEEGDAEAGMILVTLGSASFKDVPVGGARAFHDRDDRHPDGEIWVRQGEIDPQTGKQVKPYVVKCFRTPAVAQAIADKRLRELPATTKPSPKPPSVAEMIEQKPVPAVPATAIGIEDSAEGSTAGEGKPGKK